MEFWIKLFSFCAVSSTGVLSATKVITNVSNVMKTTEDARETGMITDCVTPNSDSGYCMGLRECPKLLKQVVNGNRDAFDFVRASKCGPSNQVPTKQKVCCGKYDNFVNITNTVKEDVLSKTCGHQIKGPMSRIVGGKEAFLGQFPWLALLLHEDNSRFKRKGCMGFLIQAKYVITAAHCTHPEKIKSKGPLVSVLLGDHDIRKVNDCSPNKTVCGDFRQYHEIATVTTHPEYDPRDDSNFNDIAIIRLKKRANLSDYVQPICLAKDDTYVPVNYYISGWGKTENETSSNVKLYAEIPPFDRLQCRRKFATMSINIRESQICAGGQRLTDTCMGDSGGPLMFNEKEVWYASGIVSFGVKCGEPGWPAVYTNIVKFLPWIKSRMARPQSTVTTTKTKY